MQERLRLEDLPEWMRPHQRRPDYALLGVFVLCCVVALPWLTRDGIPNTPAALGEIARIAQVAENFQSGALYPRWASHFHFGYGSPIFNYLAPLPHYLGGLHLLLAQSGPHVSLIAVMLIAIFSAGVGMFSFVRRRAGTVTGVAAALIYLLAPSVVFNASYLEANSALMLAAGFFPCVLWAFDRTLLTGDGRDALVLSLYVALLIASSTLMGWLLLGMACVWVAWAACLEPTRAAHWRAAAVGLGFGVGIMAFYWLPAVLEWEAVRWQPLEVTLRPLSLGELLRSPAPQDANLFNSLPGGELGIAAWALLILGSLIALMELASAARRRGALWLLPFIALGALLIVFITQVPSHWIDDEAKFPELSRLDLLIPLAACCAIVGAQPARAFEDYLPQGILNGLAWVLLISVIVGSSLHRLNPPPFVAYRSEDPLNSYMQSEVRGTFSGSFTQGHLLPKDVQTMPAPSLALLDSYAADEVMKVERASRLPRANLAVLAHSPTQDTFRVGASENTVFEVLTFNFLGWRATFTGQPVQIRSAEGSGFIQVNLAEGQGNLEIKLDSTPARRIGVVLSLVCGLLWLLILLYPRKEEPPPHPISSESPKTALIGGGLSLLAAALIVVGRGTAPTRSQLDTMTPLPMVFEGGVDLLGYEVGNTQLAPNEYLSLTLFWSAARPNLPDYTIQVSLIEPITGQPLLSQPHRAPGGWQTSYWYQGRYVQDTYYIRMPHDLPRGSYILAVQVLRCQASAAVYTCTELLPLRAFDPQGRLVGEQVNLPLEVTLR